MHVILSVAGGVVQDAFASDTRLKQIVVEWDAEGTGGTAEAAVCGLAVSPLIALAETDVGSSLAAAGPDFAVEPTATPRQTPADPSQLSHDALIRIVAALQQHLYLDLDDAGEPHWNIDKEWVSADICMELACLLEIHGLTPHRNGPLSVRVARPRSKASASRRTNVVNSWRCGPPAHTTRSRNAAATK
ncbi:hypothetical protein Pla175_28130 [Pirellulimonas nuda]|uniref:Uncharacterized protein n=1 Tax=Pirellulimonas nuda TaxID=2528009 RepID=A0A518DD97_9BACT|nr:hypothetical protein [Pirellulimonas nuda]QDU89423.1 hypothetical protein Pla175_28130 [Pirellulimonas nuda]